MKSKQKAWKWNKCFLTQLANDSNNWDLKDAKRMNDLSEGGYVSNQKAKAKALPLIHNHKEDNRNKLAAIPYIRST